MGCKYVKDFSFDSKHGYTGSAGKTQVAAYMRGGAVRPAKVAKVMGEFKSGDLRSGSKSGPVVKSPKQALAIAMSEARSPLPKSKGGKVCGCKG